MQLKTDFFLFFFKVSLECTSRPGPASIFFCPYSLISFKLFMSEAETESHIRTHPLATITHVAMLIGSF